MYNYTLVQWLFFFFFYCFFGWCFESAYVSICQRKPVNRGFIRGPFLPLYGTGALMMLLVSRPMNGNRILIFLAGCVGATVLEYVTGVTMEALFKVRYWDYSNQKFNFQGQICLSSTICWGFLTLLMTQVIHKPVERLALMIPYGVLRVIVLILCVYFVADFTISFQAAMDLRELLIRAEQARQDLERMQKRLDVLIAVAGEELEEKKEQHIKRNEERLAGMEERLLALEERFRQIREALPVSEQLREKRDELQQLRERFIGSRRISEEKRESFLRRIAGRGMLKGNPTMTSRRFAGTLEELKKAANAYRKGKDEKKS